MSLSISSSRQRFFVRSELIVYHYIIFIYLKLEQISCGHLPGRHASFHFHRDAAAPPGVPAQGPQQNFPHPPRDAVVAIDFFLNLIAHPK
jgi:hypothetical protein